MSLCCSPLFELTADARTWLHLFGTEKSLDVRCRGDGASLGSQAWVRETVEEWLFAPGCEVLLLVWPFEYKAFVRNPEKSKPNQSGWLCFSFREKLVYSGRHTYPQARPSHCRRVSLTKWWMGLIPHLGIWYTAHLLQCVTGHRLLCVAQQRGWAIFTSIMPSMLFPGAFSPTFVRPALGCTLPGILGNICSHTGVRCTQYMGTFQAHF